MANNLPKSMNFVEYRPSMAGIPTQAVSRYYDRLDKDALRTKTAASKVEETLNEHITIAAGGDRAYLQELFGKIGGVLDQAEQENNLPGYSKQIKNIVRDISRSPRYAAARNTARLAEEWRATDQKLASQYGRENIVRSGDDPSTFSSWSNGEIQQFQGFSTKRPDYLKGMDDVFLRNTDIVATQEAMEAFVDSQEAFSNYMKTPEGRVHINEVSQSLVGVPFNRIPPNPDGSMSEGQEQVITSMNSALKDAGTRYIKTAKSSLTDAQTKRIDGKGLLSSGMSNVSLTDGTAAFDQTIAVIDDRLTNSILDDTLTGLFANDPVIQLFGDASGGQESVSRGGIQKKDIVSSSLTSGIGPNGYPLIQIEYNDSVSGKDSVQGIGYAEITQGDLGFLQASLADTMAQYNTYTTRAHRGSIAPVFANIFEPGFNAWAKGNQQEPYRAEEAKFEIQKTGDTYSVFNLDGTPLLQSNGKPYKYPGNEKGINSLRNHIGFTLTQ